jgi:hypothetical protein
LVVLAPQSSGDNPVADIPGGLLPIRRIRRPWTTGDTLYFAFTNSNA